MFSVSRIVVIFFVYNTLLYIRPEGATTVGGGAVGSKMMPSGRAIATYRAVAMAWAGS